MNVKINQPQFTKYLASLIFGGLFLGITMCAQAATITWLTTAPTLNWSDPNNWDLARAPIDGDDVVFPNDTTDNTQILTVNDVTGTNGFSLVLNSITFNTLTTGSRRYDISGKALYLPSSGGGVTNMARANGLGNVTTYIDGTLKAACFGNGFLGFGPLIPLNADTDAGIDFSGNGRLTLSPTGTRIHGPVNILSGTSFTGTGVKKSGRPIPDAVTLNNGDAFFTYTGTNWDSVEANQVIWFPASDNNSLPPLTVTTTISSVDTGAKTVYLSEAAVASSTSDKGWVGYPSALGLSTSDPSNLVFEASAIVRSGNFDDITDHGFTIADGATISFQPNFGAGIGPTYTGSTPASTGGIAKQQTGDLTFSGTNLFTGTTAVQQGRLYVNSPGSLASEFVTVSAGATLSGDGTLSGWVVGGNSSAAIFAPGTNDIFGDNQIGTMTMGNLTLRDGNILNYQVNDADIHDLIVVTGLVTSAASVHVVLANAPVLTNGYYTLITADTITGSPADYIVDTISGDPTQIYTVAFDTTSVPKQVMLHASSNAVINVSPTAANTITFGQTLASVTLTGGSVTDPNTAAAVPGTFAFTSPTTVPAVGTAPESVTFTPTDTLNYPALYLTVDVTVDPAVIPTTPTNIVVTVSGGDLTLTWPSDYTGWTLQAQTNTLDVGLYTNWVDVPGSDLTNQVVIPMDISAPAVFYRMRLTP